MNHLSTFPLRTLTKLNMYFTPITNCSLKRSSLLYLLFAFLMERANFPMQRAAAFLRITQLNSAPKEAKVLNRVVNLFRIGSVIYVT